MSTLSTTRPVRSERGSLRWTISDVLTMARRNLLALVRIPTSLVFAIIQPIMFVLLFRYVFGGEIKIPHIPFVNYLIPGILVQTMLFGAVGTAIGLAEDLHRGLIERFRALPMARMAVLAGRTVSDLVRNVGVLLVITAVGFAIGFRPHGGVPDYIAACLLMLTFASAIFVQVSSMPGWLRPFANNQPVSQVTDAVRGLMLGTPTGNSVWIALAWAVGAILVLGPLATSRYRKAA